MLIIIFCIVLFISLFILSAVLKSAKYVFNFSVLWIFWLIVLFCIYILLGLYLTEGLENVSEIALSWVIYTILCITFANVFTLAYFWGVVKDKKGATGLKGPSGERGKNGIEGSCNIDSVQVFCIDTINKYIDELYKAKTGNSILNTETKTFPCNYLNTKIINMASSKQYKIIINQKTVADVLNYLKSIWSQWFDLIYNATSEPGSWFTDEYADEENDWINDNPFDEIKKYDVYYWGITRNFRPLKAELCRTSQTYQSSKLPLPNIPLKSRLKYIESNDYYRVGDNQSDDHNQDTSWWSPNVITVGKETYYPMGDITTTGNQWHRKSGDVISGDVKYNYTDKDTGPDMKTWLISGDIVDPIRYDHVQDTRANDDVHIYKPVCPNGYQALGDVTKSKYHGISKYKCIPSECVEPNTNRKYNIWDKYHRWYEHNIFSSNYGWNYTWDFNLNSLTSKFDWRLNPTPNADNSYHLFRAHNSDNFYKIKDSCLSYDIEEIANTKDVETQFGDKGIGWNGHPYKLESKYSIFTFLDLVPEGIVVNKATGRRYYIIHYGGEDANIYIILDYNMKTANFDNALQVDSNNNNAKINVIPISRIDVRQQWAIILQSDKKKLKLRNLSNNKYLYIGLEPIQGVSQYSSIDLDNNRYQNNPVFSQLPINEINDATTFSFISTFGTNMDIIEKAPLPTRSSD